MRGKPAAQFFNEKLHWITPAHAGKTALAGRAHRMSKDHPRACGENFQVLERFPLHVGSPPRMRGKLECVHYDTHTPGITPAHAGKT